MTAARIGCALLAAGASRRLGRPKQLIDYAGRPLVVHVLEQLAAARLARYAVVLGSGAEAVGRVLPPGACDRLDNRGWAEGIASSIRAAVRWADAHQLDGLLLAACDQPRITPQHVRALCDAHASDGATVASGYAGTRGIPALFAARWYPRLLELTGDRGAGAWLREDPAVRVVAFESAAVDLDTEEDVRASGAGEASATGPIRARIVK